MSWSQLYFLHAFPEFPSSFLNDKQHFVRSDPGETVTLIEWPIQLVEHCLDLENTPEPHHVQWHLNYIWINDDLCNLQSKYMHNFILLPGYITQSSADIQ